MLIFRDAAVNLQSPFMGKQEITSRNGNQTKKTKFSFPKIIFIQLEITSVLGLK